MRVCVQIDEKSYASIGLHAYSKEKKQTVAANKYGNRTEENTKFGKKGPELPHNNSLRLEKGEILWHQAMVCDWSEVLGGLNRVEDVLKRQGGTAF